MRPASPGFEPVRRLRAGESIAAPPSIARAPFCARRADRPAPLRPARERRRAAARNPPRRNGPPSHCSGMRREARRKSQIDRAGRRERRIAPGSDAHGGVQRGRVVMQFLERRGRAVDRSEGAGDAAAGPALTFPGGGPRGGARASALGKEIDSRVAGRRALDHAGRIKILAGQALDAQPERAQLVQRLRAPARRSERLRLGLRPIDDGAPRILIEFG